MKGYLEQKGTPTPDKPVEIKSKLIGKNLFETYEVNGKQYTDNIPKDTLICISKEEFIEYKQQKEENKRLNNIINELEDSIVGKMNVLYQVRGQSNAILELKILLRQLQELKGVDEE